MENSSVIERYSASLRSKLLERSSNIEGINPYMLGDLMTFVDSNIDLIYSMELENRYEEWLESSLLRYKIIRTCLRMLLIYIYTKMYYAVNEDVKLIELLQLKEELKEDESFIFYIQNSRISPMMREFVDSKRSEYPEEEFFNIRSAIQELFPTEESAYAG